MSSVDDYVEQKEYVDEITDKDSHSEPQIDIGDKDKLCDSTNIYCDDVKYPTATVVADNAVVNEEMVNLEIESCEGIEKIQISVASVTEKTFIDTKKNADEEIDFGESAEKVQFMNDNTDTNKNDELKMTEDLLISDKDLIKNTDENNEPKINEEQLMNTSVYTDTEPIISEKQLIGDANNPTNEKIESIKSIVDTVKETLISDHTITTDENNAPDDVKKCMETNVTNNNTSNKLTKTLKIPIRNLKVLKQQILRLIIQELKPIWNQNLRTCFYVFTFVMLAYLIQILLPAYLSACAIQLSVADVRLSNDMKPIDYKLKIIPFIDDINNTHQTFKGEVSIRIQILHNCQKICLHSYQLNISKNDIQLINEDNLEETIPIKSIVLAQEILIIDTGIKLRKGEIYKLTINFAGRLSVTTTRGFFMGHYQTNDKNPRIKYYAATNFQPSYARHAFPCFDEPQYKATFTITVGHKRNMMALSNMNSISKPQKNLLHTNDDYVWEQFAETPKMSTYMLAFVIGEFEPNYSKNLILTLWTKPLIKEEVRYLVELGQKTLTFFDDLLNVKYPLEKLDIVVLPGYNDSNNENFGLIICSEQNLLRNGQSSMDRNRHASNVIVRKIAAQWFGNIITPNWWNELWLQDGYSTFMTIIALQQLHNKYDVFGEFIIERNNIMYTDRFSDSHVIVSDISNENSSDQFYNKATSVLIMMDHFLTRSGHILGLKRLFKDKSFSNINRFDLYDYLSKVAREERIFDKEKTLKNIMESWLTNPGYPVVTVHRKDMNTITLTQDKYDNVIDLTTDTNREQHNDGNQPLWYIPVSYKILTEKKLNQMTFVAAVDNVREKLTTIWMSQVQEMEISIPQLQKNDILLCNVRQNGYYRVNYDIDTWQKLAAYLKDGKNIGTIPKYGRAKLIEDVFTFAHIGLIRYPIALDFLEYLRNEYDYLPWKIALHAWTFIDRMSNNNHFHDKVKNVMRDIMGNILKLVLDGEPQTQQERKRKEVILQMACHVRMVGCLTYSRELFKKWRDEKDEKTRHLMIPHELQPTVFCSIFSNGVITDEWHEVYRIYQNTRKYELKRNLLYGLSCIKHPSMLRMIVESVNDDLLADAIVFVSQNAFDIDIIFTIINNDFERITNQVGGKHKFLSVMKTAFTYFNTDEQLDKVENLLHRFYPNEAQQTVYILDRINVNINWMETKNYAVQKWIRNYEQRNNNNTNNFNNNDKINCDSSNDDSECNFIDNTENNKNTANHKDEYRNIDNNSDNNEYIDIKIL